MSAPVPVRLQTSVWNPMGRRRALLLHGLGSDSASWWQLASGLADDGFLVLAPDLRSHGRSPTAVDHRLATLAEDVLLLGDSYDLVVGHSLGGAVAVQLLARSGFAAAAVLIDPLLVIEDDERPALRAATHADVGPLDPAQVAAANPAWGRRDVELKVQAAAQVSPWVVDAVLADNEPWDLSAQVGRADARIQLLAADPARQGLLAPAVLDRLVAQERVQGQLVTGCGHSIHRERPEVVLRAIAEVLGDVGVGGETGQPRGRC